MIELKEIKTVPTLMRWREEVLEHVFDIKPDKRLLVQNRRYYLKHIADNRHIAIEAIYDGERAGCGAICLSEELPSPDNPTGRCAFLMNIYVRDIYRCKGIGHAIVTYLLEKAKELDCGKIYLETTSDGRSLYQSLGFGTMPDMMKYYGDKCNN